MSSDLITLAVMVLLPIVPAYLLFKALSSSATVSGPFQGLTLQLGGAFAGYFAVLLVVFFLRDYWHPKPTSETWEVWGKVEDDNGVPLVPLLPEQVKIAPDAFNDMGGGRFRVTVMSHPGPTGRAEFPSLTVGVANFEEVSVDLNDVGVGGLTSDKNSQIFTISPIRLVRSPAYESKGPPPPAVVGDKP